MPASRRPGNVLLILADQWRADCLSAVGHPCVRTPNLDALAADGVLFRRHFAQCSPCGPSRASIMTGMYLHNHRSVANGTPLDARHSNLALEVRKLGYDPVLFGYTDTSPDPRRLPPGDPALTTYEGVLPGFTAAIQMSDARLTPWHGYLRALGYPVPERPIDVYRPTPTYPGTQDRGCTFAPSIFKAEHSETAYLTDRALDWLALHGRQPWFLHLAYLRPHPPYIAPEPYHALYDPDTVPPVTRAATFEQEMAAHPWLRFHLSQDDEKEFPLTETIACHLDERDLRQLRATYYGLISEVDANIGRLVAYLKANGLYDDTLIVFSVDHGEQLGDHWMLGKRSCFDQAFHIPCIARDPRAGGARGRSIDRFTESVDLLPTMLDWLAAPLPRQCDGRSLLPFLRGGDPPGWRDAAHWEFDFRDLRNAAPERALGLSEEQCSFAVLRDERGKYVHFLGLPPLFFDLIDDPQELVNRAGDPAYATVLRDYAQRLLSWRLEHNERTLTGMLLGPGGVFERARY